MDRRAEAGFKAAGAPGRQYRNRKVFEKQSVRRAGLKRKQSIPFAELANHPLFQRIAEAICPEDLAITLKKFGFKNVAEAAVHNSTRPIDLESMTDAVEAEEADEADEADENENTPQPSSEILARALREAKRTYRLMQRVLAIKEPMNQGLRHTQSRLSEPLEAAFQDSGFQTYANPSSLQSNQSAAAYLRHLYRIAMGLDKQIGILPPETEPYRLANRRPDLARLVLSEANLKQEKPTIEIINEVLEAGLGDIDVDKAFYPIALPFDEAASTARAALFGIGGTPVNAIYNRTVKTGFPLRADFRLAGDLAGLLGLNGRTDTPPANGSEIALLCDSDQTEGAPSTATDLYGVPDILEVSALKRLQASLDLDFDALTQLLGLYAVQQENGDSVAQKDFATAFLQNETDFALDQAGSETQVRLDGCPLNAPDLRSMNYLARLHHGTGLEFHHLNLLLSVPGAASGMADNGDPNKVARRHVSAVGLRVLAGYAIYRDAFGLSPEAYAALFDQICPFWRADKVVEGAETETAGLEQTEISFMRTLFGNEAPWLHGRITDDTKPAITDPKVAAVVSSGLGLSAIEFDTLIDALDEAFTLTTALDARGLGAIYRLTWVFRMLGWPVLVGMELVSCISRRSTPENQLWTWLTAKNQSALQTDQLCTALDQLVALAQWMDEVELSPDTLLTMLTPTDSENLRATDADRAWLGGLTTAVEPDLVNLRILREFEVWHTPYGQTTVISGEEWHTHLVETSKLYRSSGVFRPDHDREAIEVACRAYLTEKTNIDLEDERNSVLLERMVTRLDRTRNNQVHTIENQVAALSPTLKNTGAGPLILWGQSNPLDLLETLLAGPEDSGALFRLYELRRYAAAEEALSLGNIGLWLIGFTPHWLFPNAAETRDGLPLAKPLNLEQLYFLQRFVLLQTGAATDAAWRGYLILVDESEVIAKTEDDQFAAWYAACTQALAILLECPFEDAKAYCEDLLGPETVADDIEKIDAVARHVRLARDTHISARELLALKAVCDSGKRGDWTAATAAARAGLSRFDGGSQVVPVQNVLSEEKRNALVAAFMQTNITANPILAERVIDRDTLYTHLLLDVQVTSAVPTSRIVEAMSSLQLYITRALNGLEPGVEFRNRDALAAQWQIDKNYRLWEANQKLALYPQNYIEPELRYVTSPQFDELLQAVSGNDLSEASAESAVNSYMAGLASVCALSVCSLYTERSYDGINPTNATYHILARADWEQGRFFYRKLEADFKTIAYPLVPDQYLKALDWTYWQEVEIPTTYQIFSDVAVCVFRNRYFFFWLEIEERKTQSPDGEKVVWRLHPRYMRCDANLLSGQMYTPGVFLEGKLEGDVAMLVSDGAFEWPGSKPGISTIYHPITAEEPIEYGKPSGNTRQDAPFKAAIYVTFGIDLKASESDDAARETSLQIRLTDAWADGILYLDEPVDTRLKDATPNQFVCIHPQPSTSLIAGHDTITADIDIDLVHRWVRTGSGDVNADAAITELWTGIKPRATFKFPPPNSATVGTIETSFQKDFRAHYIVSQPYSKTDKTGFFTHIFVDRPSETYLHTILTVKDEQIDQTIEGPPTGGKDALWYPKNIPDIPFTERIVQPHESDNERRRSVANVPAHWMVKLGESREIKVKLKVHRDLAKYFLDWYTVETNKNGHLYLPFQSYETEEEVEIGSFVLQLDFGKTNTAWSMSDVHGSRNFLHILDRDNAPIENTILLLNSSSALTKLARSMPRPGDFRDLFTLRNQILREELGTFKEEFERTLQVIYPNDETALDPARTPNATFDFDAAYGGYGWEVFYHIPAALAANYADSGQFEEALAWFEKIFDPKLASPWRVLPLAGAIAPENGLAFDTGDVIVDPDRIATDYPFYYQQATIRQYLETMLAAGDAAYEAQTQETLQQAKAIYVAARQLFSDSLPETLNVLANRSWTDPCLGEAASDDYTGFLPPYNRELRELYNTIQSRLANLRRWLDIEGNPLNVPLLSAPIDPRQLQRAAKAQSILKSDQYAQREEQEEAFLDFPTVALAVRTYLGNLKTTSSRIQDNFEKADGFRLAQALRVNNKAKAKRAWEHQGFVVNVAETNIAIKRADVAAANSALANYFTNSMALLHSVSIQETMIHYMTHRKKLESTIGLMRVKLAGKIMGNLPSIFGTANGGQEKVMPEVLDALNILGTVMNVAISLYSLKNKTSIRWRYAEAATKVSELFTNVMSASLELSKAKAALDQEEETRGNLKKELEEAEDVETIGKNSFGNSEFYDWMKADLEQLFAEEFSVTLAFCRLLVKLYEDETDQKDGESFLKTTSLGSGPERFNAPYRLALEVERLELAYVRSVTDQQSQSASLTFALSDVLSLCGQRSAVEALIEHGESYFELTEAMFETLYPGQYDRRILSVSVRFPGLAKAGLNPHARLIQIANTRYATHERDPKRGGKVRKNRYAMQSIVISAPEVDTAAFDCPGGLLKRFQNTGVESRWRLVLPTVYELKSGRSGKARSKAWRDAATKHLERLTLHLDDIEFKVTFSGRW